MITTERELLDFIAADPFFHGVYFLQTRLEGCRWDEIEGFMESFGFKEQLLEPKFREKLMMQTLDLMTNNIEQDYLACEYSLFLALDNLLPTYLNEILPVLGEAYTPLTPQEWGDTPQKVAESAQFMRDKLTFYTYMLYLENAS